jgi:hypothetical protein
VLIWSGSSTGRRGRLSVRLKPPCPQRGW